MSLSVSHSYSYSANSSVHTDNRIARIPAIYFAKSRHFSEPAVFVAEVAKRQKKSADHFV